MRAARTRREPRRGHRLRPAGAAASVSRVRMPVTIGCVGFCSSRASASVRRYFLSFVSTSPESAAMNASCGTSTRPTIFMRFLPSFCFSRSLRLRVMSPP